MVFWQGFLLLSILAAFFILWPTIVVHMQKRKQELTIQTRGDVSAVVYNDRLEELEATHGRGEIEASELEVLKEDLEKTRIYESEQSPEMEKPIIANWKSRIPVIALSVGAPIVALLIYFQLGSKHDWDIYQLRKSLVEQPENGAETGVALVKALQKRLDKKPNNSHNWYLLGVTATELGQHEEAVRAFRKLDELEPNSAVVLTELAQALFRRAGTITPEVRQYIHRALAIKDDITSILGLAGIDAFQNAQYEAAIDYWSRAITRIDPRSSEYHVIENGIQQAKAALGAVDSPANDSVAQGKASTTQAKAVTLRVSIGGEVDAAPTDTVFIYARAWQGARIPLAIQKLNVADLPATISLDESMAMDPSRSLASASQVEVVARISRNGNAVPQAGDWQVSAGPIVPGEQSKPLTLRIDSKIE